jgi:uncharacterized protein (TIGR02001 family)
MIKRSLIACAAVAAAVSSPARADDGLAFNLGAVSEYSYRGLSQSRLKPAVQGGLDFSKGAFYLGAWASTIKWVKDGGGDGSLELDLYGGYKGELSKGLGYDLGLLAYQYPGHKLGVSPNTTEVYGALSYGVATLKYSHSVSNLFGFANSKGSGYLDLSASFDLGDGWTLAPHLGYQRVAHSSAASYTDYALALSKELKVPKGTVLSATLLGTDTDAYTSPAGKNLGKARVLLGAKLSF